MSIHISIAENIPGTADGLMVRMFKENDGRITYDRYCGISDKNNKASQIQMFKSLIQMIKEITAPKPESE